MASREGPPKRITTDEAIAEFLDVARQRGLRIPGMPIADGKVHRVPVDDEGNKGTSGAYLLHLDHLPAGFIRNWKTMPDPNDKSALWQAGGVLQDAKVLSTKEIEAAARAANAERQRLQQEAAAIAKKTWDSAKPASDDHPYLRTKGVPSFGLRVTNRGNLVKPLYDLSGEIINVQGITENGKKLFLKNGRISGTFFVIGDPLSADTLMLTEGYATAATVHLATGLPTVDCSNCGNIEHVLAGIRAGTSKRVVIAADDDRSLPLREKSLPNSGRVSAEKAAKELKAETIFPRFPFDITVEAYREDPQNPLWKLTDWNDLQCYSGIDEVINQFSAAGLVIKNQERAKVKPR